jgi:K+-transporting ATPase KdpF subunit
MMGVNASYPLTNKLTGTVFVINGYWHLADANHVPSSGAQFGYKVTDHTTLKETVLFGPHQSDTGFEFWRFLWDSIAEWKTDRITTAFEYHLGTEKVAAPGNPRALWMFAQLPVHWGFNKNWSATVRPEVYWDRDGRLTGLSQTVKANTTTLEYRVPYRQATAIVRLEHRIDDSRGRGGGFFRGGEVTPGVVGLPAQTSNSQVAQRERENHDIRRYFHCSNGVVFHTGNFLRSWLRTLEVRSELMHAGDAALLVICALLFGYLLYALLKAEEF